MYNRTINKITPDYDYIPVRIHRVATIKSTVSSISLDVADSITSFGSESTGGEEWKALSSTKERKEKKMSHVSIRLFKGNRIASFSAPRSSIEMQHTSCFPRSPQCG